MGGLIRVHLVIVGSRGTLTVPPAGVRMIRQRWALRPGMCVSAGLRAAVFSSTVLYSRARPVVGLYIVQIDGMAKRAKSKLRDCWRSPRQGNSTRRTEREDARRVRTRSKNTKHKEWKQGVVGVVEACGDHLALALL